MPSELVLIGGGHAHVHVIKSLGTPPLRDTLREHNIRPTLIARDLRTPYSGMLPGMVAGHYTDDDIHLDLTELCAFAGFNLIHASAVGITCDDDGGGTVLCDGGRDPVRFDVLSIDVGSAPAGLHSSGVGGVADGGTGMGDSEADVVPPTSL